MVFVSNSLVSALVASSFLVGQAIAAPVPASERGYPGGGPRTLLGRLVDYKVSYYYYYSLSIISWIVHL